MGTQLSTTATAMLYYDDATSDASGKSDDEWSHAFEVVYERGFKACKAGDGHIEQVGDDPHLHPRLRELTLNNWHRMGADLGHSAALKKLDLHDCGLTAEHITALFGDLSRWSSCKALQWINLDGNDLGSTGIAALVPFLKSSAPHLDFLLLNKTNMGDEGAMLIANALENNHIWSLNLNENSIGDAGVESLLSVENSAHLGNLKLAHNKSLGQRGIDAITNFLRKDNTELENLSISVHGEEYSKPIVDSISKKSKLRELMFFDDKSSISGAQLTQLVAPSLKKLICDTSSFESLCESNHRLQHLVMNNQNLLDLEMDFDLKLALEINSSNKYGEPISIERQKIRAKLRAFYFHGEFDMTPFANMDMKLMPNVSQLITKTRKEETIRDIRYHRAAPEAKLSSIFHMLRNKPELVVLMGNNNASLKKLNEQRTVSREELRARCSPRNYPEMVALKENHRAVATEHLLARSSSQKRNGGLAASTEHLHARCSSPSKRTRRGITQ